MEGQISVNTPLLFQRKYSQSFSNLASKGLRCFRPNPQKREELLLLIHPLFMSPQWFMLRQHPSQALIVPWLRQEHLGGGGGGEPFSSRRGLRRASPGGQPAQPACRLGEAHP